MPKRPLSLIYIVFYLLFLPDTWRLVIGLGAALILAPLIDTAQMGRFGIIVLYIMIAGIGYAAASRPARAITNGLKKILSMTQ